MVAKKRARAALLDEKPHFLLDGLRTYSLGKHPVPPRARLTAGQSIRWARFTMNPSGPRTDAMRQMPSY